MKVMFLMQRIVSADWLQPGEVVYHEPRGHYYELLHRTLIKSDKKDGSSWLSGWCYQEVKSVEVLKEKIRHEPPAGEVYSRPMELFDEDWRLVLPL